MSVSGFLSSIADKAQNAINQTPLAGHIPGTTSPVGDNPTNRPGSQGGLRSLAFESLQHQIRNLGEQYRSTSPVQRIITLEKGVALDLDALARDAKNQSKELYTWGQDEDEDVKDVTDRLAYLNFVQGALSTSLAVKLDNARAPLKALRDAEANIAPKRNIRAGLRNQIARVENNQEKGGERRIAELREQLARAEHHDEALEKQLGLLKRKAVRESERNKWDAIREYGEKLILLSQATKPIIEALPTIPPNDSTPYAGADTTAAARASLQRALDNYKPGNIHLDLQLGADFSRSDTRSFGETHASELSSLASPVGPHDLHSGLSVTPPLPEPAPTTEHGDSVSTSVHQPPIDTSALNQRPGPVPPVLAPAVAAAGVSVSSDASATRSANTPSEDLYGTVPAQTETAEEEKKRLEREERERVLAGSNEPGEAKPEKAEEEKARLEREERERVLTGGANPSGGKDGDELPPYQDFQQ